MRFKLEINTHGAVFIDEGEAPKNLVADFMHWIAADVRKADSGEIRDRNGKKIGSWEFV